jgi:hypothetical protein
MRFFVVGRDRSTGNVRIVSESPFDTRQQAIDSLASGVPAELGDAELFVVDLEIVTPIVLVSAPAVGAGSGADAWEAPEETLGDELSAVALASRAEVPDGLLEPLEESGEEAAGSDLADALRRAATTLEDEGIVAPPQVEELAAMAMERSEEAEAAPETAAETEAAEPTGEEAAEAPLPEEPAEPMSEKAEEETPAEWPWESAHLPGEEEAPAEVPEAGVTEIAEETIAVEETVAIEEPAAADEAAATPVEALVDENPPEDVPAEMPAEDTSVAVEAAAEEPVTFEPVSMPEGEFRLVGLEEPAATDISLIPAQDEAFNPMPVILGDYADMGTGTEEPAEAAPEAAPAGEVPDEIRDVVFASDLMVTSETEPPAEEPAPEASAAEEPVDAAAATELDDAAADGEPGKVYEPGEVNIDAYTCDDCVYVGTCPKHHEDSPSTCGSFQWKA